MVQVAVIAASNGVMNSRRVESRTGAVAWAMWQHSVSCPRSSNRTCRFPASGFPTSFIVRHTEKSSGRKRPLRGGFSPLPYGTAFSEGSGSRSVLQGSSPITFTPADRAGAHVDYFPASEFDPPFARHASERGHGTLEGPVSQSWSQRVKSNPDGGYYDSCPLDFGG
jgi:hypothetical protein